MLECLVQSGIKIADIGPTFQADHALPDGNVAESSIDHVYYSANLEEEIKWEKLATSSSDHVPVLTSLKISPNNKTYIKRIKKRSMKNFTTEKWLEVLAAKQWKKDEFESDDVEDLALNFDKNIEECLNEIAPYKVFIVKSHHKFGISESTKKLMEVRDKTRKEVTKSTGTLVILSDFRFH